MESYGTKIHLTNEIIGAKAGDRSIHQENLVSNEAIRANVKVCMFDQYGTVVDMQGGLTAVAAPFLKDKGWKGDPNAFVTWWRRTHFENSMIDALLHREHTPYREIGHRSVAHVMERAGIPFTMDEVRYLVGEIEKLKRFRKYPKRWRGCGQNTGLSCSPTAIPTCSRPPGNITRFRSTG